MRCTLALCLASASAAFAGTSTSSDPTVTFSSPGLKEVELEVCNNGGCSTVTQTIAVLDPMPSATSLFVTPTTVPQGATVSFTASGAGKPPLDFSWRVVKVGGGTVATLLGATAVWNAIDSPGVYDVYVDVSNAYGTVPSLPVPVVVTASQFLFGDGFELGSASRWSATQ